MQIGGSRAAGMMLPLATALVSGCHGPRDVVVGEVSYASADRCEVHGIVRDVFIESATDVHLLCRLDARDNYAAALELMTVSKTEYVQAHMDKVDAGRLLVTIRYCSREDRQVLDHSGIVTRIADFGRSLPTPLSIDADIASGTEYCDSAANPSSPGEKP